jgi:hypothetical protein
MMRPASRILARLAPAVLLGLGSHQAPPGSAILPPSTQMAEVPYNGRFTFTRVRYGSEFTGRRRGGAAWAHDYPSADRNIQLILNEFTSVWSSVGSNVFQLEDPEIFRYPILYLSEPGYWSISADGARNLRSYLLKGGLIIFDDFEAEQWVNFEAQLRRALPEHEMIEIDGSHPVFQSFFHVNDIYVPHPLVQVDPKYFAMFEDNDPAKRMMVLVNYNADLAEYWEWSGQGFFPVDLTNEAYKLGVNYIVFALTH